VTKPRACCTRTSTESSTEPAPTPTSATCETAPSAPRELDSLQWLRARLRDADLHGAAPPLLWRRIREHLERPAASRWTLHPHGAEAECTSAAAALDAHLRSLEIAYPTDVAATDARTVKPRFEGTLLDSPDVVDLVSEGFPLVGGRLDVLEGRTVAALVYRRSKHIVSVFIWPADGAPDMALRSGVRQGYRWVQWSHAGMRCWVVSDLALAELENLASLLRA
jgi:anti-sigma factor RsiW